MPKATEKEPHNRRWYDQEPACTRIMTQMEGIRQPRIREFSARVMINFTERIRKSLHYRETSVNAIGISGIANLYQFGAAKKRWYDEDPITHKAVGMLYTLPLPGLSALGFSLGDTFGLLEVYSAVCCQVDLMPEVKDMARIVVTAVQSGKQEAEDVLMSIVGEELYEALSDQLTVTE